MRVKIQQFLWGGTLFSWSVVGENIGRSLLKKGHDVEFISTDGIKDGFMPKDLISFTKKKPNGNYDCQISYTIPHNFMRYLSFGNKNRFGIWNFDGSPKIPSDEVKFHRSCDQICPSSNFSKQIFINSKIPRDKITVIPHGIDLSRFNTNEKYPLKTNKKYKILCNISTPHIRKNLENTLKTYGEAFSKEDDVSLILKVSFPKCSNRDEIQPKKPKKKQKYGRQVINVKKTVNIDFYDILNDFKKKYKNHAEIKVIKGFIPNLVTLYNACDIVFMMSHMEMWWLPGTEAFAAGKLVIASNYGGQLHYLNDKNSLLIDGDIVRMPKHYQYWNENPYAEMFQPSIDDGIKKLKFAIGNYDDLMSKFSPYMEETINKFTWDNVAHQIERMCV